MSDHVYQAIFDVAKSLELPVVILALLALVAVIFEVGAFAMETVRRRRRNFASLARVATAARGLVDADDRASALSALDKVAWSNPMAYALADLAREAGKPGSEPRIAKRLADFDFESQRRLGRTRLLVRFGPAIGLMGTLIPLSPALQGLAQGDVQTLSQNLRIAFSVTVLGLLIGLVAFALSLYRDRIYGQDYSDLEYVAAILTAPSDSADAPDDGRVPRTAATPMAPAATRDTP
jgi:biopolymer transport protein ExbB/TolQ